MKTPFYHMLVALSLNVGALAATEDVSDPTKTAGYHLKSRSAFTAPEGTRVPFWPIGWTPASKMAPTAEAPAVAVSLKADQFSVTSILLGSQSLAVINGRTYGEGELLKQSRAQKPTVPGTAAAPAQGGLPATAKVRVVKIMDGAVVLQSGAEQITVELNRPKLNDRKPSDEDALGTSVEG